MAALLGLEKAPKGFGVAIWVLPFVPASLIAYWVLSDLFGTTRFLGPEPIIEAEHLMGSWTLRFLLATLAITPLRKFTHWNWLARHRRTLGLITFAYAILHFLVWFLLDRQVFISAYVGWSDLREDLVKRPFILIGMLALLLLVPLAVTSTKRAIARLGKSWRTLHRLVYVIAILGVIHFWMAVKRDIREPAIYILILALLLGWRWREARRGRAAGTQAAARA